MTSTPIFAGHHAAYLDAGWSGILPLPPHAKHAPPAGYTGADGRWPTRHDIDRWAREQPDGNIALRLPRDVIGVDLDLYRNADARNELERLCGPLPPTWCSTSRVDGSGIRFYRVPPPPAGTVWQSAPVPGVEIVQHHHRYAVVWPSIHPEGREYLWVDETSGEISDRPPEIDELTELPWAAIAALAHTPEAATQRAPVELELPAGDMSVTVERRLHAAVAATKGERGSRHDAACRDVTALIRLAERGEPGVERALALLEAAFVAQVGPDRAKAGAAEREFDDIVNGARRLVASTVGRIPTRAERDAEWQRTRELAIVGEPPVHAQPATAPQEPRTSEPTTFGNNGHQADGVDLRWVDAIPDEPTPEPPELIEGFMRQGELLVVGAPRAIGKSWLAMNIATVLARGEGRLFGHLPVKRAARVLVCQGELDRWGSEQRWLKLTGLTSSLPNVAETFDRRIRVRTTKKRSTYTVDGVTMTDEHVDAELSPLLEQLIVEHRFDVVILDPWATYYAGNESSNDEVEAALDKLRGLTLRLGVSWVIFHHIGKSTEHREPEDAWRGASRLADWASTRVTVMPHYTERQRIDKGLTRKAARAFVDVFMLRRSDPTEDFSMHRGDDGWWRHWTPDEADEALDAHGSNGRPPSVALREFINELASAGGEWASVTEAGDALGVSRHVVSRLVEHAESVGLVALKPGEKRSRRIVLTPLGADKADRFVGLGEEQILNATPDATPLLPETCETLAFTHTTRSEAENVMCESPDAPKGVAFSVSPGQSVRRERAKPPYYVGERGTDVPPPDDTNDEGIDPFEELGL